MTPTPLVISHRTNMGTLPENTIAGAEAAIRDRVDGIEMDVRSTRDGELVLLHDGNLERTTDGHEALAEVTLEQLRSVRVQPLHAYQRSEPVPTLREMLTTVDGRAILVLELKESGLEERVALLLDDASAAPWCWVWSFMPTVCAAMRAATPEVPVSLLWSRGSAERHGGDPVQLALELDLAGLSLQHNLIDASTVERAHTAGLRVATYTVNDLADIDRVRDAGVDAICGDVPTAIAGRLRG